MHKHDAINEASALLGGSIAALLSDADMWSAASRTLPDDADDTGDYDPLLVAAEAADLLGIRAQGEGGLTEFNSEGTTLKRTPADFFGMAAALRGKSTRSRTNSSIGVVSVATGEDFFPAITGDGYWTWDSDLPAYYPWRSPDLP